VLFTRTAIRAYSGSRRDRSRCAAPLAANQRPERVARPVLSSAKATATATSGFLVLALMSVSHTSPTPIPPAFGEFDLLHETAGHPLIADLLQRAMGDDYPVDVDPSSSCTRSLLSHILEMLALRPADLLVDLGCGRGGPGLWLARETKARLVGLDFSPKGIALARRTAERFALQTPAQFLVASFDATGLPDASADGVVSVDALPFAPDRDAALRELRRVLRPGARAVFTAATPADDQPPSPSGTGAWPDGVAGAGLELDHDEPRPDVPSFWLRLYRLWEEHEVSLRTELGDRATDNMLAEAREVAPKLATLHFRAFTVRRPKG
jgi:SAM-dependent methyltransferase